MRLHYRHITTRQTAGINSASLQSGDNALIGKAGVGHNGDVERCRVGDSTSLVHLDLDTQLLGQLRAHNTATVYQDERLAKRRKIVAKRSENVTVFD